MKRLILWAIFLLALVVVIMSGSATVGNRQDAAAAEAYQRQLAAQASEAEAKAAKAWVDTQTEQQAADSILAGKEITHLGLSATVIILLTGGATALSIIGIGGALAAVRWAHRKATTIYPNQSGQWPIILFGGKDSAGHAWSIAHDPNRSLGPITIHQLTEQARPFTEFPTPADATTMAQITTQAQAINLVAANGQSNHPTQATTERFIGSMLRPRPADLPEIRPSQWDTSHVDRLLLEAGESR